jgi:hypothetical protein
MAFIPPCMLRTNSRHKSCAKNLYIIEVRIMVFNATFNIISVISYPAVLLEEETGVYVENQKPAAVCTVS